VPANPVLRWLGVSSLWVYRMVTWTVVICGFVFALGVFGVRFWLLPNIENYRETIARELSAATKHRITIGRIEGRWSGFNLQLTLGELALYDSVGQPALKLERVDSTLSWWSLIHWEPRFDSIEIERPDLNVRRDKRGVVSIAGVELTPHSPQSPAVVTTPTSRVHRSAPVEARNASTLPPSVTA